MSTANSWRETPQRYRLEAGRCTKCGKIHYPPRRVCDACGARDFEQTTLPYTGKLVTYTIVELDNGVRTHCQLADVDFNKLQVGMPVKLEFRRIQEGGEAGMIHYGHKAVPA
jgi:uncharacterized OB-fold protein